MKYKIKRLDGKFYIVYVFNALKHISKIKGRKGLSLCCPPQLHRAYSTQAPHHVSTGLIPKPLLTLTCPHHMAHSAHHGPCHPSGRTFWNPLISTLALYPPASEPHKQDVGES